MFRFLLVLGAAVFLPSVRLSAQSIAPSPVGAAFPLWTSGERGGGALARGVDLGTLSGSWHQGDTVFGLDGGAPVGSSLSQVADRKEPALAGALSFLVPFGTGSFYAGNSKHGLVHLTVGAVAAAVFSASFCVNYCPSGEGQGPWAGIALVAFSINWVAGTVVAVSDAKAFNRGAGAAN